MLILTRRQNEEIWIGDDIRIRVIEIRGKQVRLAFEAPRRIGIHRLEIIRRNQVNAGVGDLEPSLK